MSEARLIAVTLRIHGRVQGVGYRAWSVQKARQLQLRGWVRNLTDGTVEAYAQGSEDAISAFIAACQAGPPGARVTDVRSLNREIDPPPAAQGFHQKPTDSP